MIDSRNPSGEAEQLFYRTLGRLLSARPEVKIVVIAGEQAAASGQDEFWIGSDRAQPSDNHRHDIRDPGIIVLAAGICVVAFIASH